MIGRMKKLYAAILVALAAMVLAAVPAFAAVTFDPNTGIGFAGKGDVQTALGWNNQQLQQNADQVQFQAINVSEQTWECTNPNNEHIQQRLDTTTQQQVVDSTARVKNQVTGFNLNGYTGEPTIISQAGPPLNSCPSGWTLTQPAGNPVVVSSTLQVSGDNGSTWVDLLTIS